MEIFPFIKEILQQKRTVPVCYKVLVGHLLHALLCGEHGVVRNKAKMGVAGR